MLYGILVWYDFITAVPNNPAVKLRSFRTYVWTVSSHIKRVSEKLCYPFIIFREKICAILHRTQDRLLSSIPCPKILTLFTEIVKLEISWKTEGSIMSPHDFFLSCMVFFRIHSSTDSNCSKKDALRQKSFTSAPAFWQFSVSNYFKVCVSQQEIEKSLT